jgi:hypothetical protein
LRFIIGFDKLDVEVEGRLRGIVVGMGRFPTLLESLDEESRLDVDMAAVDMSPAGPSPLMWVPLMLLMEALMETAAAAAYCNTNKIT